MAAALQRNDHGDADGDAQQQPNFTLSASPASLSIQQGNQGTSTITTTISGGFNGAISLSAAGMPPGTTVSFNPRPIPAPGAGNSTMTHHGRSQHASGNLSHHGDRQRRRHAAKHHGHPDRDGHTTANLRSLGLTGVR